MTNNDHDHKKDDLSARADEILCTAMGIEDVDERSAYVVNVCADDAELYREVNELLSLQDKAETLFQPGHATRLTAADIVNTLTDSPDFFDTLKTPLPDDDEVGKQIGNYKLLQKIGEGGVGNVYLAEQIKPMRRQVALKIIKAGMDTKSVIARFEAERQALAMMEHPNIAHVLNAGETETGRPYFVMDLVHGERITTYCDEHYLTIQQRLELFIEVCHAIQHAHQKSIIHRDIKPSNVLISHRDGKPSPIVIDFGIAKATGGELLTDKTVNTSMGPIIGTPAYMSPEQTNLSQIAIDTRSDTYSLGVLLYELLTGMTPFDQKELLKTSLDEMCRILREQEPLRPSNRFDQLSSGDKWKIAKNRHVDPKKLYALLSGDLDWIVMKTLEKDRDCRYESVGELAAEVQRFLNHEPVSAGPPSRLYRFRKLVHRNRVTFAYLTAITIAVLAGLGTSTWLFTKERAARKREAKLLNEADARTQIAQAYILISRDKPEEAERLMDQIQIPVIEPSLEAAGVFRSLAEWHVTQGRWQSAAEAYLKLQQANQLDKSNTTAEMTSDMLGAGPALIAAGMPEEYHRFVHETIVRFANTTDPSAAEQVIKNSLILPQDESILQQLPPYVQVVKDAVDTAEYQPEGNPYYLGWRTLAISLYEYRCGNYDQAIYWGKRSLMKYEDRNPPRVAMDHVVVAMSYAQLGRPEDARDELLPGRLLIEERLPTGTDGSMDFGMPDTGVWHDWVIAYFLLQEADALLSKN